MCAELDTGSHRDGHRLAALDSLIRVYNIFEEGYVCLTDEDTADALRLYEEFMLHYNWLLGFSISRSERCYNFVYKHHHMWHIIDNARWINPRLVWCYEFEDFVGVLTKSAKNCIFGSPMTIIANKAFENYLLVLSLAIEGLVA